MKTQRPPEIPAVPSTIQPPSSLDIEKLLVVAVHVLQQLRPILATCIHQELLHRLEPSPVAQMDQNVPLQLDNLELKIEGVRLQIVCAENIVA